MQVAGLARRGGGWGGCCLALEKDGLKPRMTLKGICTEVTAETNSQERGGEK